MKVLQLLKGDLIKSTGIYGVATLLNAVLPFLLLPVLSYYLSPAEYGLVAMFLLMQNIFGPLVTLNVPTAISKRYFYDESNSEFSKYVGNSLLISLVCFLILLVVTFLFRKGLSNLTELPEKWLFISLVTAACFGVIQVRLTVWQMQNKAKNYAILQVSLVLIKLVLSLFFVVVLLYSWEGRASAILIANIVLAVFSYISMVRDKTINWSFDRKLINHAVKYGAPIIPHSLAGFAIAYTDRLTINSLIGLDTMGLYTVAYQVSSVFNMATNAFNMAFIPWLYKQLKKSIEDAWAKFQIVKITYLVMGILILSWLLLVLFLPFVFRLLSVEYNESTVFLNYLLLGFMFNGMYYMFCNYLFYSEKTAKVSFITISSAILNVPLTYVFVMENGAIGAAQATAIVNGLTFMLTWYVSSKVVKMPWFSLDLFKTKNIEH